MAPRLLGSVPGVLVSDATRNRDGSVDADVTVALRQIYEGYVVGVEVLDSFVPGPEIPEFWPEDAKVATRHDVEIYCTVHTHAINVQAHAGTSGQGVDTRTVHTHTHPSPKPTLQ